MCRDSSTCSELPDDPAEWGTHAPLSAPDWVSDALSPLAAAVMLARKGDIDWARRQLTHTREAELREWFDVHAQNVGRFRFMGLGAGPRPPVRRGDDGKVNGDLEQRVAERDHWTCRYCGQAVFPHQVFRELHRLVGPEAFPMGRTNAGRHGARLVFGMSIDHVHPHSRGGATAEDNMVVACWPCNFGKADYTLSEIGLDDPREREPVVSGWTGMTVTS